jgi:hypothetical protein
MTKWRYLDISMWNDILRALNIRSMAFWAVTSRIVSQIGISISDKKVSASTFSADEWLTYNNQPDTNSGNISRNEGRWQLKSILAARCARLKLPGYRAPRLLV